MQEDKYYLEWLLNRYNKDLIRSRSINIKEIIKGRTSLVAKYQPISNVMRWSIDKLKMSEQDILSYIDDNYSWPKSMLSRFMLATTKSSPGKIDVFYKGLAYVSLGSVITYSFFRNMKYVF